VAGVDAGLTLQVRSTQRVDAALAPTTASTQVSGLMGALTELQMRLSERVGMSAAVGAEGVLWRTKLAYQTALGEQRIASVKRVEPWMILGFFVRW
jgi:hypothetical protein